MQHPIIHNSVIDRVQLIDTPSGQQDWAPLSKSGQDLNDSERQVESGSSGASEIPE